MKKIVLILFIFSLSFSKEQGVLSSFCLSGTNAQMGESIRNCAKMYFDDYNSKNKNKIKFSVFDDEFNSDIFRENILSNLGKNTFVFMPFDTANLRSIVPKIINKNIIVFSPVYTPNFLNFSVFKGVIKTFPSFDYEIENAMKFFVDTKNLSKISIIYQSGEHGEEAYNSLAKALINRNLSIFSSSSYKRNSNMIEPILENIDLNSELVVFALLDRISLEIAKKLSKKNENMKFLFLSSVNPMYFKELKNAYVSSFSPASKKDDELLKLYKNLLIKNNLDEKNCSYNAFLNAFLVSKIFESLNFKDSPKNLVINRANLIIDRYKFYEKQRIIKFNGGKIEILYEN